MTFDAIASRIASPLALAAALVCLAALGSILTALAFEHIGGYAPCPLCLMQRIAYYAAIPIGLLAFLLARGERPGLARALLVLLGIGFLINAGLGVYHSGVEWHWWPGPVSCAGGSTLATGAGGLLESLNQTRVVRCDEAPWRMFGLSFAGYSVLLSLGLAAVALYAGARAKS